LIFQRKLYETVIKKYKKKSYTWMPVEETNAKLKEKGYHVDALENDSIIFGGIMYLNTSETFNSISVSDNTNSS